MKKRRLVSLLLLVSILGIGMSARAQEAEKKEIPLKYGATYVGKRQDDAMKKFRENRLGAFIHWGLYAIPGGEWNGKVYNGAAEWLKSWAKVPSDEWMKLMKEWNPKQFDAQAWAKMMKLSDVSGLVPWLFSTKISSQPPYMVIAICRHFPSLP